MRLIICEKHKAAQRISAILSHGKSNRTFFNRVALYDFIDQDKIDSKVIGLKGHVLNLDFPKELNRWNAVDPKILIQTEPIKKVQDWNIVNLINKIATEVDEVIIATDYDREGELIGVEGLELVQQVNPKIKVLRARFSALTGQEVNNAFKNLTEVDFNLSSAANSRQIIDLKWGAVLTRFISLASNQTGKDFLSVGRVQSPTLALIVDRDKEITKFIPKTYWQLVAHLEKKKPFNAQHQTERFWDSDEAQQVYKRTNGADTGLVSEVETKEVIEYPPAPFNTTSFLRAATTLDLSAAKVMSIAEELYTNGLISYPRTDNTVYPKSLNLRKILELFKSSAFSKEAEELLSLGRLWPTSGKVTATDHPPIHPVGVAKQKELSSSHWKVYDLVVRRFMATLAPKARAEATEAIIEINTELFEAKGYTYLDKGWISFYPYFNSKERSLPALSKGDKVKVIEIELLEKETQPPKRYSQGSLIQEMDKLGLGTKSTRHDIIQKLYSRGYIENNVPIPTPIGTTVTSTLEKFATTITKPDMTAMLENDMDEIAQGNKEMQEVVKESEDMLGEIMKVLEENKTNIGKSIQDALYNQNIIGTCKDCKSDLVIIKSRRGKRFIGCSKFPKCRRSYPLPQAGKVIIKGTECKLCGAPEVQILNSKNKKINFCVNMACDANKNNRRPKK